jgi:hypothetical protein
VIEFERTTNQIPSRDEILCLTKNQTVSIVYSLSQPIAKRVHLLLEIYLAGISLGTNIELTPIRRLTIIGEVTLMPMPRG